MANAGYSGSPLIRKLGIKPEMKVLLIHQPEGYFQWLDADISDQFIAGKGIPDLIHLFTESLAILNKEMTAVLKFCKRIHPQLYGYPGIKKCRNKNRSERKHHP